MKSFVLSLCLLFAAGFAQACDYGVSQVRLQSNAGCYGAQQLNGYGAVERVVVDRRPIVIRERQRFVEVAPVVRVRPVLSIRIR